MNKENLTAYEVVTEENLTDIHSTGWLLRHKKTGARVMLIENDDGFIVSSSAFTSLKLIILFPLFLYCVLL